MSRLTAFNIHRIGEFDCGRLPMGWAEAETNGASLPDARLKRRLTQVLEQLSAQPTESIDRQA